MGLNFAYWLPDIPQWIVSLVLLVLLTATNLFSVKSFGEFEFWFSSIKVATIGVFIFLCSLYLFGFWPNHQASGLGELLNHGGFMPNGWVPVLSGAVAATGFILVLKSSQLLQQKQKSRAICC